MSTTNDIAFQSEPEASENSRGEERAKPTDTAERTTFDKTLFRLIAQNDEDAFRKIFHHYRRTLYPAVLSIVKTEADAKEILQETFLKVWTKRASLTEIDNPGGWLYTVAANTALTHLRDESLYNKHLKISAATSYAAHNETDADDVHDALDAKELKTLISEAVEKLPARRRQMFRMTRLEGYTQKDVARAMNISENTVRNQLGFATEFVRDYIREHRSLYLPATLVIFLATGV